MTPPESIVWRDVERRLRPIDCGLVTLANGVDTDHGPAADADALQERVRAALTEFCEWWLVGHRPQPKPTATSTLPWKP